MRYWAVRSDGQINKNDCVMGIYDTRQWFFYVNSSYMPHEG